MPEPDTDLRRFVRESPLTFGAWRELKSLYKKLEADPQASAETMGALIARLDSAPLSQTVERPRVNIGRVQRLFAMAAQGDRLAVALNRSWNNPYLSLLDFNVANRLQPKKIGMARLEGGAREVSQVLWCGPLIVVVSASTIQVFEPEREALKPLAQLSLPNVSVAAQFPYLYVLSNKELRVVDLRDIHGAGTAIEHRGARQVVLGEGFLVVLGEGAGFAWNRLPMTAGIKVLDITDPARPLPLGELALPQSRTMALENRTLFVTTKSRSGHETTLHRIDLTELRTPRVTGQVSLGYSSQDVSLLAREGMVFVGGSGVVSQVDARGDDLKPSHPLRDHPYALAAAEGWLYTHSWQGVSLLSMANPERPAPYGTPPSPKTLGYMKRRARRYLRGLAQTAPTRFVELALQTLMGLTEPLDATRNWVAWDLLFGAGKRFEQRSHGRGALVEKAPLHLSIRRREERGRSAWDAHPERAAQLYLSEQAVWQARELALKALRAAKATVPDAKGAGVATPSLLLTAYGVRELVAAKELTPERAALGFARAIARQRTALLPTILRQAEGDAKWKAAFVECVLRASDPAKLRRIGAIAGLVAQHFPEAVGGTAVIRLVPGLLASGKANLRELALRAAMSVDEGTLEEWLEVLLQLREIDREPLLVALETGAAGKDLGEPFELMEHESPLVRGGLWRVLAASATPEASLRELWDELLLASSVNDALQTAMGSAYALATLGRAGYTAAELAATLIERPFLVGILDTHAFTSLTQTLPVTATLSLIAAADDTVWGRIRDGWVRNLREGLGITELWSALPEALKNDLAGSLETRVLNDTTITECLLVCEAAARLLEIRESALGPLLGRWLVRHWPKVESDEGLLLTAATHALAEVRAPALEMVGRRTIRLPFALRLLECEIPGSVAVGQRWFEASSPDELESRALALCDSPVFSVRAYGRQFATTKAFTGERLALALFEHDEPDMQAFAAEVAGDASAPSFDRTVLRARHKSRRAKERVKARQESAAPDGQVDIATLLALARGAGSTRDAEWALVQLTKRALAGESVEGLSV